MKIGDKVKIIGSHDFEGVEGTIHKLDNKRGYAEVQVDMFGEECGVIVKLSNLELEEDGTEESQWEKETKEAVLAKIKPALEEWAKEHNEKTIAKRKFKRGDILAHIPSGTQDLRFMKYKEDGRVYAVGFLTTSITHRTVFTGYNPEYIAPENQFILQGEYEEQQKPQVGDEVVLRGKIVRVTEGTDYPYDIEFDERSNRLLLNVDEDHDEGTRYTETLSRRSKRSDLRD